MKSQKDGYMVPFFILIILRMEAYKSGRRAGI